MLRALGLLALAFFATSATAQPVPALDFCETPVALTDLVDGTYCGAEGGLYDGSNTPPAAHAEAGWAAAARVQPLGRDGQPDPGGRVVLLSISMSNATQEWCHAHSTGAAGAPPCNDWTFMGQAAADLAVNHATLAVANGAKGGQALDVWDAPDEPNYDRVRDEVLAPDGLTEAQVQAVWVKAALLREPTRPALPAPDADAVALERTLGDVLRALRVRYPNLQVVFVTPRIFSYAPRGRSNSPEPYAYESGFAVKAAVDAQIRQRTGQGIDAEAGDLGPDAAPWVGWGPYLWAPGDRPRADGLQWTRDLLQSDGVHPNRAGETLVADSLLAFFKTSPFTRGWFTEAGATAAEAPPTDGLSLQIVGTPTRGAATVRLTLPEAGRATAAVYDLLGREVAVLHDGSLAAGEHAFRSPASLAPGVYLVRAVAGAQVASQTLTVVR